MITATNSSAVESSRLIGNTSSSRDPSASGIEEQRRRHHAGTSARLSCCVIGCSELKHWRTEKWFPMRSGLCGKTSATDAPTDDVTCLCGGC